MQPVFSYKRVLVYAWDVFVHNAPFLVGILSMLLALALGNNFIATVLANEVHFWVGFLVFLVGMVMSILLWMGLKFVMIKITRRKHVRHEELLTPAPYLIKYVAGSFFYSLVVTVGLFLLVVPGIVWAVKYSFHRHLIVDKGLDPFQALYVSGQMTEGHKWDLLWFLILLKLINLLGVLCAGVGLLVTLPYTSIARARVYDRLLLAYQKELEE